MEGDVIKRAFELAPKYDTIGDLKRRLIAEGYLQVNAHLSGRQIRREILQLLKRRKTA